MRAGYAEFLTFCEPTARGTEHEIKALKGVAPAALRCGAAKGQSTLLAYDRAIVDFRFAYNLKQTKSIYVVNLPQILKSTLRTEEGIEDTKAIRAYHQQLDRRERAARKAGRVFPRSLYQALYRPTEVSLQFIRWIRSALLHATRHRAAIAMLRPLMLKYL